MTPPATSLLAITGNLLQTTVTGILNGALKRSQEEVYDAVRDTLVAGRATATATAPGRLSVDAGNSGGKLGDNEPAAVAADDLQVSAKLFLYPTALDGVDAAEEVDTILQQLQRRIQLEHVDNFTVAFANFRLDDDLAEEDETGEVTTAAVTEKAWPDMNLLERFWQLMERQWTNKRVRAMGVAEFSQKRLDAFQAAVKLAPASNQVNMADSCVIPRELINYCRAQNIDLVTHSDASDLLPDDRLQQLLQEYPLPDLASDAAWTVRWVLKFSVLVKSRGILHDKGYIVYATRV